MSIIQVAVSELIDAPPTSVYAVIADYRVGHPAILPGEYFSDLTVTKGGYGEGTEITFRMKVFGQERTFDQVISEPEPGRLLVERERDGSVVTRFTVDPVDGGARSRVTIASDIEASPGVQGIVERLLVPILNRRIYRRELQRLAAYTKRN